jgi:putative ABC transport system permease protein
MMMRSTLRQATAILAMNLSTYRQRPWSLLSPVASVAIVVVVLASFLALSDGFQQTVADTGSKDVGIFLRGGARSEINSDITQEQVALLGDLPEIQRDKHGTPLVSPEIFVPVSVAARDGANAANLSLRGLRSVGPALRPDFTLVSGRMFHAGAAEIIVGSGVLKEFAGLDVGHSIRLRGNDWVVVGVFSAGGTVAESEAWADLPVVQSLFNRGTSVQSVRVAVPSTDTLHRLRRETAGDPRLKLDLLSEADYYAEQAANTTALIRNLGWPLAIAMAVGAIAASLNTIDGTVEARMRETGTLRAIGFSRTATFCGVMAEALTISAIGGVAGTVAVYVFLGGLAASTVGSNFTEVVFHLHLGWSIAFQAILLSAVIGFLGGAGPALRAGRVPILLALAAR